MVCDWYVFPVVHIHVLYSKFICICKCISYSICVLSSTIMYSTCVLSVDLVYMCTE